jgi:hypothetical protein
MTEFAHRFHLAPMPPPETKEERDLLRGIERQKLPPTPEVAWFLLRGALVREDASLLTLADAVAERASTSIDTSAELHYVRARIAHARSDDTSRALYDFCSRLPSAPTGADISMSCWFLTQWSPHPLLSKRVTSFVGNFVPVDTGSADSVAWLEAMRRLGLRPSPELLDTLRELAEKEKRPDDTPDVAEILRRVCFWAFANELADDDAFRRAGEHCALACLYSSTLPETDRSGMAAGAFALLRWYQHTGEPKWLSRARLLAGRIPVGPLSSNVLWDLVDGDLHCALAQMEMERPETAELPPFDASSL